jgi:hypothetical protein
MASKIQFGVFELDRDAAELRKHGVLIRLQEQPLPWSIGESRLRLETQHMKQHHAKTLFVLFPLAVLITATACGQGGTASPPPPLPISVAVSPKLVPVQTGTTLQFTATVSKLDEYKRYLGGQWKAGRRHCFRNSFGHRTVFSPRCRHRSCDRQRNCSFSS